MEQDIDLHFLLCPLDGGGGGRGMSHVPGASLSFLPHVDHSSGYIYIYIYIDGVKALHFFRVSSAEGMGQSLI